jgi:hypothetical protein
MMEKNLMLLTKNDAWTKNDTWQNGRYTEKHWFMQNYSVSS